MPNLNAHVIALCGRDTSLIAELQPLKPVSAATRLECCGYVDDMPARLRRASVLVARPSCSLFLESILAGVPLLIPANATKNDSGTVDLTRAWRIGETYETDDAIPATLERMLPNLGEYRARLKDVRARYAEPREHVAARIRSVVWRAMREPPRHPAP
jgi:UDP-N-acetylglucosamine:LPS N-acetylglucosamine transferase